MKTSFRKNITDDSVFFYGSGMYMKHPNHTYGRNWNNSANNWAIMSQKYAQNLLTVRKLFYAFLCNVSAVTLSKCFFFVTIAIFSHSFDARFPLRVIFFRL